MSKKVIHTRSSGGGIKVAGRARRLKTLVVADRTKKTTCNHALAVYDVIRDVNGRDKLISYARNCVVDHGPFEKNQVFLGRTTKKDQVHRDSIGREWS